MFVSHLANSEVNPDLAGDSSSEEAMRGDDEPQLLRTRPGSPCARSWRSAWKSSQCAPSRQPAWQSQETEGRHTSLGKVVANNLGIVCFHICSCACRLKQRAQGRHMGQELPSGGCEMPVILEDNPWNPGRQYLASGWQRIEILEDKCKNPGILI